MKESVENDIVKNSISGRKCCDDEQKGLARLHGRSSGEVPSILPQ